MNDLVSNLNLQSVYLQQPSVRGHNYTDTNVLQTNLSHLANSIGSKTTSGASTLLPSVINLIDNEYVRLQKKEKLINDEFAQKTRIAMLNESVRLRYVEYTKLCIILVITFIILFTMYSFQSSILAFIPSFLFDFIVFIICVFSLLNFYFIYNGIILMDPMYFDELNMNDYNNASTNAQKSTQSTASTTPSNDLLSGINGNLCIGGKCCNTGTTFDLASGVCIPSSS
jgi:hypothetical protein